MKIAIIGSKGYVGKKQKELFSDFEIVEYDSKEEHSILRNKYREKANKCDVAFVCVPTPENYDGSCDTSIVEDVVSWLKTPLIIIRSTVKPGTTDKLSSEFNNSNKEIVFQPEYVGETPNHPMNDIKNRKFIILGGSLQGTTMAQNLYQKVYGADVKFEKTSAMNAEMVKYFFNTELAIRVVKNSIFHLACEKLGADYQQIRELVLLDDRINSSHSLVYPEKLGYGGKCFPKDIKAFSKLIDDLDLEEYNLFWRVDHINNRLQERNRHGKTES